MKAQAVLNFAAQFGINIALNPDLTVEKNGRFYLVNPTLKQLLVRPDYFYAGVFLGKAKEGKFFPSFNLLSLLAKKDTARIVLDAKAAWLFICGRDILAKSVVRVFGSGKKHTNVLVLNEFSECLGFGRIIGNLSSKNKSDEIAAVSYTHLTLPTILLV